MTESAVTASCKQCGGDQFRFDRDQPDQQMTCVGCGTDIGTFREVQAAMAAEAKRVMNDAVAELKKNLRRSGWK